VESRLKATAQDAQEFRIRTGHILQGHRVNGRGSDGPKRFANNKTLELPCSAIKDGDQLGVPWGAVLKSIVNTKTHGLGMERLRARSKHQSSVVNTNREAGRGHEFTRCLGKNKGADYQGSA